LEIVFGFNSEAPGSVSNRSILEINVALKSVMRNIDIGHVKPGFLVIDGISSRSNTTIELSKGLGTESNSNSPTRREDCGATRLDLFNSREGFQISIVVIGSH